MRTDPPIVPLARTIPLRRTLLRCYRSLAKICWQGKEVDDRRGIPGVSGIIGG